jgi:hypothetical protein
MSISERIQARKVHAAVLVCAGLLRACLRSSEQQPQKRQVDHLQAGVQFAFAVLP